MSGTTFEYAAFLSYNSADAAIARIGAIVHCLDVGGAPVAEAPGVEAVLAGLRAATATDDRRLAAAARVFDNLHRNYTQESAR